MEFDKSESFYEGVGCDWRFRQGQWGIPQVRPLWRRANGGPGLSAQPESVL